MKAVSAILRACFGLIASLAIVAPAGAAGISTAEYRQQLRDFSIRVEQLKQHPEQASQFERDLPDSVLVQDGSQAYEVDYRWLKSRLTQFQRADSATRSKFLQPMQDHIAGLDKEAAAYLESQTAPAPDREKIAQILSRREFRKAHGPTWLDILLEKIMRRISEFFTRHPGIGESGPDVLHIFVYAAVAIAFSVFAVWLFRRLKRPQEDFTREIIPFSPSARGWSNWLAEARRSAQAADWRNAVHLAYWAGISFLEQHGAWKPDRARTPREYLRILGARQPQYPTLSALTRKFEVIWYGGREAQAADFQDALQQLEKLGCK